MRVPDVLAAVMEQFDHDALLGNLLDGNVPACSVPTHAMQPATAPSQRVSRSQAKFAADTAALATVQDLQKAWASLEAAWRGGARSALQRQQMQALADAIKLSAEIWLDDAQYIAAVEAAMEKAVQTSQPPVVLSRFPELLSGLCSGLQAHLDTAKIASSVKSELQPLFAALQPNQQAGVASASASGDCIDYQMRMLTWNLVDAAFQQGLILSLLPSDFELVEDQGSEAIFARQALKEQLSGISNAIKALKDLGERPAIHAGAQTWMILMLRTKAATLTAAHISAGDFIRDIEAAQPISLDPWTQ